MSYEYFQCSRRGLGVYTLSHDRENSMVLGGGCVYHASAADDDRAWADEAGRGDFIGRVAYERAG